MVFIGLASFGSLWGGWLGAGVGWARGRRERKTVSHTKLLFLKHERAGWLAGWLAGLAGWLAGWAGWLGWLAGLAGRLAGWSVGRLDAWF